MPHRLFIGIRPPEPVRDCLVDLMEGLEGARWQGEEQLHVTLRFVGETETRQANDIAEELSRLRAEPFALELAGLGHFEKKGRAHTLWAGLAPCEPLAHLQRRVEMACRRAGLAPETRKFAPHITIARLNRATAPIGAFLARHGDLRGEPWLAEAFTLYESHLSPQGSIYEPVMRYPLVSEPAPA